MLDARTAIRTPLDISYDYKELAAKWKALVNATDISVRFMFADGSVLNVPSTMYVTTLGAAVPPSAMAVSDGSHTIRLSIGADGSLLVSGGTLSVGSVDEVDPDTAELRDCIVTDTVEGAYLTATLTLGSGCKVDSMEANAPFAGVYTSTEIESSQVTKMDASAAVGNGKVRALQAVDATIPLLRTGSEKSHRMSVWDAKTPRSNQTRYPTASSMLGELVSDYDPTPYCRFDTLVIGGKLYGIGDVPLQTFMTANSAGVPFVAGLPTTTSEGDVLAKALSSGCSPNTILEVNPIQWVDLMLYPYKSLCNTGMHLQGPSWALNPYNNQPMPQRIDEPAWVLTAPYDAPTIVSVRTGSEPLKDFANVWAFDHMIVDRDANGLVSRIGSIGNAIRVRNRITVPRWSSIDFLFEFNKDTGVASMLPMSILEA